MNTRNTDSMIPMDAAITSLVDGIVLSDGREDKLFGTDKSCGVTRKFYVREAER